MGRFALSCVVGVLVGSLAFGCAGSGSGGGSSSPPLPDPQQHNPLTGYALASAPVTSSVPHVTPVWMAAAIAGYAPHPSVRLTRSALRPGDFNTPAERLLEEAVLTRPALEPRIAADVVGAPEGWTVVAMVPRITLSVRVVTATDQFGNTVQATRIDQEANGLTDCDRRVVWCWAKDDAVTPEGDPLMAAYAHELRRAWVYEIDRAHELARGASPERAHEHAKREAFAADGTP